MPDCKKYGILCPVDRSEHSRAAIRLGSILAARDREKLIFMHVNSQWMRKESELV